MKLTNDIHNTETTVKPKPYGGHHISAKQVARARRILCGMADCTCGGWHGPQHDGGRRVVIEERAPGRWDILAY